MASPYPEAADQSQWQACVVVAKLKDLARFVRLRTSENIFREELELLIRARLVDSDVWHFPAAEKQRQLSKRQAERQDDCARLWKQMGKRALETFFSHLESEKKERLKYHLFDAYPDFWNSRKQFYNQNGDLTVDARAIKTEVSLYLSSESNPKEAEAIRKWFDNMFSVQSNITHSSTYPAIFVRDEASLRDLVSMDQPLEYLRVRVLGERQAQLESCRWNEYCDAVLNHVYSAWRSNTDFRSTTEKLGFGIGGRLPSKLVR